jgi:hypothetical protein
LAAAYMLRMLQKVAYGGTNNPVHSGLKDLGLREVVTLTPLLVFVFWIGLHPEPFTRVMEQSVQNILQQTQQPAVVTVQSEHGLIQTDANRKGQTSSAVSPGLRPTAAASHETASSGFSARPSDFASAAKPVSQ